MRENAVDAALFERWGARGWGGKPADPPPRLPRRDRGRYLLGDTLAKLSELSGRGADSLRNS